MKGTEFRFVRRDRPGSAFHKIPECLVRHAIDFVSVGFALAIDHEVPL